MKHFARGVLEGIAFGEFAALMIHTNLLALKTLWRFNRLALETAFAMKLGLIGVKIGRERGITMQSLRDQFETTLEH